MVLRTQAMQVLSDAEMERIGQVAESVAEADAAAAG